MPTEGFFFYKKTTMFYDEKVSGQNELKEKI